MTFPHTLVSAPQLHAAVRGSPPTRLLSGRQRRRSSPSSSGGRCYGPCWATPSYGPSLLSPRFVAPSPAMPCLFQCASRRRPLPPKPGRMAPHPTASPVSSAPVTRRLLLQSLRPVA
ncbi:hypothetical protein EVAR_25907_1 [Eumeta japonica]|uniref:Uncharacterized protein n=1 Tax=Eumeta variegata TaxID=151549 RepID=A0A4C1W2B3_EUMVA|nr:hypothetical protein EVAR_25907_1 [Eumeta japonica]